MTVHPPLIPRRVLFGDPERTLPQLSPDGKRLAFVAPLDGVLNVWVGDLDGDEFEPVTRDRNRGVTSFFWQRNGEHLLYAQDRGGDESWRLFAVDLAGGEPRDLTPYDRIQVKVMKFSDERPNEMLLGLNLENPMFHDLFHLEIDTGLLTLVEKNPGFHGTLLDSDWSVRGAIKMNPDTSVTWLSRPGPEDDWTPILEIPPEDAAFRPMGYTPDGSGLYFLTTLDSDTMRLIELDSRTGELRRVVLEDPGYDIVDASMNTKNDACPVHYGVVLKERFAYIVANETMVGDFDALQARCDGDIAIVSKDTDSRTWLVAMSPSDGPAEYHVWDREARDLRFLFRPKPAFGAYTFGHKESFSFTARDGLEIHGYLTFPAGV
ncbi:MAG: hypothetical protein QOI20_2089, partial [Acidimicrobiaceae bacterium]|nr:hypothetical protein [Acidimicrobiaceae bacterium]